MGGKSTWCGILARNSGSPGGPKVSLGSCHHRTAARAGTGAVPGATARCTAMPPGNCRQENAVPTLNSKHSRRRHAESQFSTLHRDLQMHA